MNGLLLLSFLLFSAFAISGFVQAASNDTAKPSPTTLAPTVLISPTDPSTALTSMFTKTLAKTFQKFAEQFRYELNLSFLRDLLPTVLQRSPVNGLTIKSLLSFNLVSLSILLFSMFVTYFIYPIVSTGWIDSTIKRVTNFDFDFWGNKVDEIHKRVSRALDAYSHIDSEVCMKIAMCTLGKKTESRPFARSQEASMAFSIVDHILQSVKADTWIATRDKYKLARDFGQSGGDCDAYNRMNRCPLDSQTWNLLLTSVTQFL